jgi:hypothetical protein
VGRYAVNWVYRDLAINYDRTYIVLGDGDYTDVEAHNSQPPTPPPGITALSLLVGRILVKQGDPTAHSIDSAFDIVFAGTPVIDHNDLPGLNVGDYQHLTAAQHMGLIGGVSTTLHLHPNVISSGAAGFMTGADKLALEGLIATSVPSTRTLTAGNGLTGGGDLSANRTFTVQANADGSIVVGAGGIGVGALASNAQHGNRNGGTLHTVASGASAGFMSTVDKTKLDGLPSSAVPTARILTAGNGLTGGGDLSADRTFTVSAHSDGSITVGLAGVQVGTLATDAQHGNLGNGALHTVAVAGGNAGFMSGSDKTKLDGLITNAVPQTRTLTAGNGLAGGGDLSGDRSFAVSAHADGSIVSSGAGVQVGVLATDAQHGSRGGGTQHAIAVAGVSNGFMSSTDKTKLDGISGAFGTNFQITASEGTSTSSSSTFATKVSLTTGALTGTYRIAYSTEVTAANAVKRYQSRLYNVTDGAELCYDENSPGTANVWSAKTGYAYVTFTGAAKTFSIEFASADNSTPVSIRRSRLELWRVV